jgi:hypothetical protein
MSFRAKRELLAQVAPRYREAGHKQRSIILDLNGHVERPTGGRAGIHRWPDVSPRVAIESPHPG